MVDLVCQFNNQAKSTQEWMNLTIRIYETICEPVPLFENYKFLECWNILLETAFLWKLKIYCAGTGK